MAAVLPLSARQGRPRNPLLMRDDVGLAKPSCYDLPSNQFAFGKPGNMDPEGAREVTSQWNEHKATEKRQDGVSFLWLNKKVATAKVTTARDLAKYRRELEEFPKSARAKSSTPRIGDRSKEARAAMLPRDMPQDFVFGRKIRPSTPVQEVVSYQFARDAERELLTFYNEGFRSDKDAAVKGRKLPLTMQSRPRMEEEKNEKKMFKMGKFQRVGHKVDTRRQIPGINAFDQAPSGISAFSNGHLMPDQGKPDQVDQSSLDAFED